MGLCPKLGHLSKGKKNTKGNVIQGKKLGDIHIYIMCICTIIVYHPKIDEG
jgi:hypothetical protein